MANTVKKHLKMKKNKNSTSKNNKMSPYLSQKELKNKYLKFKKLGLL